jgi:HPt (histidine-containing phosphotransfer) domain-containing protein
MDDLKKKELQEKIIASRNNYKKLLPGKIQKIEEAWELLINEPWNDEQFLTFHRMVHTIAGSSGTFGLPEVGQSARQLEILLKPQLDSGEQPSTKQKHQIRDGLRLLITSTETAMGKETEPY